MAENILTSTEQLEKIMSMTGTEDMSAIIGGVLSLKDDSFALVAPQIMENYINSLSTPNARIVLAQSLNASGVTIGDLNKGIDEVEDAISQLDMSNDKKAFLRDFIVATFNAIQETEGIATKKVKVAIELCDERAKIPQYAHVSDSGADVFALDEIIVKPGETVLVPTGFKIAPPDGYEIQIRAKSGRALKTKMRIANAIGTIDQGYRDEVKVIIENIEPKVRDLTVDENGKVTSIEYGRDYVIGKGEKFCQIVLASVPKAAFYETENIDMLGQNRNGGFGSTGLK